MEELKSCPFCGSLAEIYTGQLFPRKSRSALESESDAQAILEEWKKEFTVVDFMIYRHVRNKKGTGNRKKEWRLWADLQGFIPRCSDAKCLGRLAMRFKSEEEATAAWNQRSSLK